MGKQVFGRRWSVWMADTVLYKFPELRNRWAYDYGVVCKGLGQVYTLTGNEKYFQYIKDNMDHFVQEDGSIRFKFILADTPFIREVTLLQNGDFAEISIRQNVGFQPVDLYLIGKKIG